MIFGDSKASEIHRVSLGSIKRYRKRLETDPKMIEAVAKLKDRSLKPIEPTAAKTAKALLEWLEDLPKHVPEPTASIINAMSDAYRTIEEIEIAKRMIDSKLAMLRGARTAPTQRLEPTTVDAIATEAR